MIIDNRYHFRITPARSAGISVPPIPAPEAFLTKRKLIKTPATEETDAVYYTEADGLSIKDAIEIYYTQEGSCQRKPV